MYIRELMKDEMQTALELAWIVFCKYEAPNYSEDGIKEFYRSVHDHQFLNSLRVYGAFENCDIVGTIATCNNGSHIALFFVSERFQHQGIGKALFAQVCQDTSSRKVTVNSSPFAVPIYHQLGFTDLDEEQVVNGLRFIPMVCSL